jgi:hypothetical protein
MGSMHMVMARRREKHSKQENWNVNPWDSYIFIRANIRHRVKTKKSKTRTFDETISQYLFPIPFWGRQTA